ncbi:G2484-1 protein [Hirschfeldia incana]|nr:G2484-1 protein [Hirschfeldia incana]
MDFDDDNDFQNQNNLHLAGEEANNKFPLPRFDFDYAHLRFDSLVGAEGFLGMDESFAISRHNNVWSEATSSESVEMLLNSVGQDQVVVKEKSGTSGEQLGCTMEQLDPGQTNHENILSKEETANAQPNPYVVDTPGDSSLLKTDAGQEQVVVKDDSPTVVEESSMEEDNSILASNTAAVEDVDTACRDKVVTETTDSLLDQTVAAEFSIVEKNADVASISAVVEDVSSTEHDKIGTGTTGSLLTVAEESSMEENTAVLASVTVTRDTAGHDKLRTETTGSLLDQTEELRMEEKTAVLASDTAVVEDVNFAGHDKIGTETADSVRDQTAGEETSMEENNAVLASDTAAVDDVNCTGHYKIGTGTTDSLLTVAEESSMGANNTVLASVTMTREAVDTGGHGTIRTETSDSLLDQTEDEENTESRMEIETVQTGAPASGELNNQTTLLPEVLNDENDISDHTAKSDLKNMELSDVTVLERGDQALSALEVGEPDVSGTQCQDLPVSSAHTSATVAASLELAGVFTNLTSSEHKATFQTETDTEILRVETSESVNVSQIDSMVESTEGGVSKKSENKEGSACISNLKQIMELAVSANDRDQDAKSSEVLSESVVSESIGYVSRDSASKLVESKSQSGTIPVDKSRTMIDVKECEAFPLNPEESQHLSQGGASAVSLTSSIDLHVVNTSSHAIEQVSVSVTEKVSSGEPENCQTVPPVEASSSVIHIAQQPRKHTEDTQQGTQVVDGCPAFEGSKDAVDADAVGQVLPQQCEETVLEENLTEVVNVPEIRSGLDKDAANENLKASSLANLRSEAVSDCQEEDKTAASDGIMTSATPVSYPTGVVIGIGESCASTSATPFVKSHITGTEDAVTNIGTPVISSPALKTTELHLNKTETNSVKKPEDQNTSSLMSTESPFLNRNATVSSELNLTSDPRKAVEISKATLVSPTVVGSPSKSSLEKTAPKSSKTKSERKRRRTPKSAGKETSRKGNSVKGAAPFQHFQSAGKANAVIQGPTASLPDLNSSSLSNVLRRPFTDSQQVQLRAQIFVYGGLIQGTAPDEAYMISAFGGADGGKGSWEKAWRACAVRAQRMRVASPETPAQSRAGKTETPFMGHTSSKESSATKPIIPLSSPLWSLSTPLETLQSRSIHRGSAAALLPSSSHAHQAAPITNIGHNTAWMSPLPYPNPWLTSPQTSGFDVGSRFPVFPITESVKLTPTKEPSLPYSGGKHVLTGTSGNVFKGTQTLESASTVLPPGQPSSGTKSRKRKKMPVSVESDPSILNSLQQTEVVPVTAAPGSLASNVGTLPSVGSISAVPMNLVSTFPGKKMKSSLQSPIFGGNLASEVKQISVFPVDTIDKLNEAKMHAEDASALATAAVSQSEYVWKQIEQQRHTGLQPETQGILASAAVAIAAAAAVAKAAAAAANVAAGAAFQAKLMAEEAAPPSVSYQGNELPKSNDVITQGQGSPASILKGEGAVVSSSSFLSAAREAAKKRVEAATAATKQAENMDSIIRAAELASEAVSQAGILVSMGHPPSLNKLVEVGPSGYWRQARDSVEVQPCKVGVLEKETVTTSDRAFASPSTTHTEMDGSRRTAGGLGLVSATGKKTNGRKSHISEDVAKHTAVAFEPEVGSKSSIDTQAESEQIMKKINDECIKEGSHVEVFKEGPELRTAWYSANVLSVEDGKAYVLFNDLSVEQGTNKLKEWVALKGEGDDEAPKIRTARSITALPYEGTRKRRRAAIGDPVWKIGDRVDSWVHDSWLEGVITEKNKKDENTVTVHFPAQGETLTIKAWNLRPSLVWKDGKWTEYSTSGENISSSNEGDTPKEKRPRVGPSAPVSEVKDTKMETADDPDLGKMPQTGVLDLGVSETTFNIGTSTREAGNPGPPRMKRTGLQTQGAKVIYGVPKPGKTRKFMDVSKHYVSEASNQTRKQKEPAKPVKPIVPQNPGPGSWRLPSKPREKQTTTSKPKSFIKAAPKTKEKPVAASRVIPRKDSRNTPASSVESDDAVGQSGENNSTASGTVSSVTSKGTGEEQNSSSITTGKGIVAPTAGRLLAKIEEDKALADNSSNASDGMEPRRSVRRIQPTSRLLEGLQSSMMTSKIPSMSQSRSHQSRSKK